MNDDLHCHAGQFQIFQRHDDEMHGVRHREDDDARDPWRQHGARGGIDARGEGIVQAGVAQSGEGAGFHAREIAPARGFDVPGAERALGFGDVAPAFLQAMTEAEELRRGAARPCGIARDGRHREERGAFLQRDISEDFHPRQQFLRRRGGHGHFLDGPCGDEFRRDDVRREHRSAARGGAFHESFAQAAPGLRRGHDGDELREIERAFFPCRAEMFHHRGEQRLRPGEVRKSGHGGKREREHRTFNIEHPTLE